MGRASRTPSSPTTDVVIVGGGIVGLTLALALRRHVGIQATMYESAAEFAPDVGAGMGMYPNGLRVLRDIDPDLVTELRRHGQPFGRRRWERADGSLVMEASEEVLTSGDKDLEPFGIRRWKLQQVLYEAVQRAGISVHFSHTLVNIESGSTKNSAPKTVLEFKNGARVECDLVFGADGGKSAVRNLLVPEDETQLEYTGVTCLMGIAEGCSTNGITSPTSTASRCHAVYFPTGPAEECFMLNVVIPQEETCPGNWGQLTEEVGKAECQRLAMILKTEGWDQRFLEPLLHSTKAVRIGYCLLRPKLTRWVFGTKLRVVLVGDAAHPPVPYTGQGAQQGLEDAGTIALLMKHLCRTDASAPSTIDWGRWSTVAHLYEKIRIPRADEICDLSMKYGEMQQRRADSAKFDVVQGEKIQRQVFFHETLPCLIPGATHDYRDGVAKACDDLPSHLPVLLEEA